RFRGSIKAEMRRFFAKNIPAPRISRHGDGASIGASENPFPDWLISNKQSSAIGDWQLAMQCHASGEQRFAADYCLTVAKDVPTVERSLRGAVPTASTR